LPLKEQVGLQAQKQEEMKPIALEDDEDDVPPIDLRADSDDLVVSLDENN